MRYLSVLAALAASAALAAAATAAGGAAAPPFRATLVAASHAPQVGRPWPYAVTATDLRGRPLAARLHARFLYGGLPVGEAGRHAFVGIWAEALGYPAAAAGQSLTLEVAVTAAGATRRLRFDVTPGRKPSPLAADAPGIAVAAQRRVRSFTLRARGRGPVRWTVACNRGPKTVLSRGGTVAAPAARRLPLPAYFGEDCAAGALAVGKGVTVALAAR